MSESRPADASVDARWFDGLSSRPHAVSLHVDEAGACLQIRPLAADIEPLSIALSAFRVSPRLHGVARQLELPHGQLLETRADDWVDRVFVGQNRLQTRIERLERRLAPAVGLGLAALLVAGLLAQFGMPWLLSRVTDRIPWSLERQLGEQTLALLNDFGMAPSELSVARQAELQAIFGKLCAQLPPGPACELHFFRWTMANAFALPGGQVIFTDRLVELLKSDAEFVAIAGHELGHVRERHALRGLIASASMGFLFTAAVGDVTVAALGGGFTSLDSLLAAHSREQESAADRYAFQLLRSKGLSPLAFADIIERLQQELPEDEHAQYLSSHPATAERSAAAREAARK